MLCSRGDSGRTTAVRGCAGKDAFQLVREFGDREWDAVERVLTNMGQGHDVGAGLSGLTGAGSLLCSRALVTEWFLAQRESGYRLAGYELD
jgi:hypothetical protein